MSLRKVARVLGWLGVERSHVAIWTWIQKFGRRLTEAGRRPAADLPAVLLLDETVVNQRGQEFTLFAAVDPETRHLLHSSVAPSRNTLTTRRFLTELAELYGRMPPIVVTDGASYGPVFTTLGVTRIIRQHSVRNRIERWMQELKRRIDTFYASFTGNDGEVLRGFCVVANPPTSVDFPFVVEDVITTNPSLNIRVVAKDVGEFSGGDRSDRDVPRDRVIPALGLRALVTPLFRTAVKLRAGTDDVLTLTLDLAPHGFGIEVPRHFAECSIDISRDGEVQVPRIVGIGVWALDCKRLGERFECRPIAFAVVVVDVELDEPGRALVAPGAGMHAVVPREIATVGCEPVLGVLVAWCPRPLLAVEHIDKPPVIDAGVTAPLGEALPLASSATDHIVASALSAPLGLARMAV